MSNRVLLPLLAAVAVGGLWIGFAFAGLDDEARTDAAVAEAIAAVTPEPTPEPTPIPTPWIVEVEVAAPVCIEALDELMRQGSFDLTLLVSIYDAYLDHPDEGLEAFGRRVEAAMLASESVTAAEQDAMFVLIDDCRAAS